ncbi:YbbR-like domain-containing protein [Paenibacillus yanchengensis]|uniref:YbbR-like domain-containing protein n=1 Tax=Paenibacillus yanchengensis TaxID=2035833 RepID=A0ABW4YFW7_9BACL
MDKWFNHPTVLKIIALVIALLLWAVVHIDLETKPQMGTSNYNTTIIEAVTIVPVGLDTKRFKLAGMEPTVANLVVGGRITSFYNAADEDYVVNIDLSNMKAGFHEVPLSVKLPKGIQKVELFPQSVIVNIEEIMTNSFDVEVVTKGSPQAGLVVGTPVILSEPGGKVEVTLTENEMVRVKKVVVEVDLTNADKTVVSKKARLIALDSEGNEVPNAQITPETVHVEVPVNWPSKQVPLQIRYSGALPSGSSILSVEPEVEQVTVFAEQHDLERISIFDGYILDLSKVKEPGEYVIKASAIEGVKSVTPAELKVTINVENSKTKQLSALPITFQGKPLGESVKIVAPDSGKINLLVSGTESALAKLKDDDISVIANIADLPVGNHTIPLEIELPPYIYPVQNEEQTLMIEVVVEAGTTEEGEDDGDQEVIGRPEEIYPTSSPSPSTTPAPSPSPSPTPTPDGGEDPTNSGVGSGKEEEVGTGSNNSSRAETESKQKRIG